MSGRDRGRDLVVYEERHVILKRGALDEYRRLMLEQVWPALVALGARPLCLLSGLIGLPATEIHSFTGYRNAAEWDRLQLDPVGPPPAGTDTGAWEFLRTAHARRAELVEEERARLWRPSEQRPRQETPIADRRAVYGMRRFTIHAKDWPDFVRYSSEGVWVRIEAQDARILGLFRDAAATDPLEVMLLTGYHGPAHWEETRFWRDRPPDFPADLWELGRRNSVARNAITLRSHVSLMTAHWPDEH